MNPTPDRAVDTRPLRAVALATAAVFLLNGSVVTAWISRLPATRDRLNADPRTLGLILLMAGLGALLAMPVAGRVSGRIGSKPVVITTALVSGVALVLMSLAPNAVLTGATLFLFGATYGSWDVAMNIQGSHVDRRAGRDYMPRYHACWSLGSIVGAALGALAAAVGIGLTVHFTIAAVVAVVLTVVVVLRWYTDDRDPIHDDSPVAHAKRGRLFTRRIALIGVIMLCGVFIEGAAADWLAIYLHDDRGASQSVAALGFAVFATAMTLSRFAGTGVIDRFGRARAVRAAGGLAALGITAALALPGLPGALLGVLFWGAGTALVFPAAISAGGESPGRPADSIAAITTIGYGGFLLGPPLIGLVAGQVGLDRALWVLPVLGVTIAVLSPAVASPSPSSSARAPGAPPTVEAGDLREVARE